MYPPEVIHMKFLMAAIPIIEIRIVLSLFRGVVAVLWNPKKKLRHRQKLGRYSVRSQKRAINFSVLT